MKTIITILTLALLFTAGYAGAQADTIMVNFSSFDVDQWASLQPSDSSSTVTEWVGWNEEAGRNAWQEVTTTNTWSQSFITVSISRVGSRGNFTGFTSSNRTFQVRQDSIAAITSLQGELNQLYTDLAAKDSEILAKLDEINSEIVTSGLNDQDHPNLVDQLLSLKREQLQIETAVSETTDDLTASEGNGLPGWSVTTSVTAGPVFFSN